jgi:hypothetical protein
MSDDSGGFDPEATFRSAIGAPSRQEINSYNDEKAAKERKTNFSTLRNKKMQELMADTTIDMITKEQLASEFGKVEIGMSYDWDSKLEAARKGVGIYGINRKNAEMVRQLKEKPGRQQTILTQGAKELSGTESTGILTGYNK